MTDTPPPVSLGKGRPTPKRRDKERRTGPVPPPPQTRREAAQRLRAQGAAGRKDLRAGYVQGDESKLLKRDRGPVRRTVRDVVDSRRNVGTLLLPLAVLLVTAQVVGDDAVLRVATSVWTAGLVAVLLDLALLTVRVRRALRTHHPEARGTVRHVGYAALRSTVLRRFRMPPPQVAPGDTV